MEEKEKYQYGDFIEFLNNNIEKLKIFRKKHPSKAVDSRIQVLENIKNYVSKDNENGSLNFEEKNGNFFIIEYQVQNAGHVKTTKTISIDTDYSKNDYKIYAKLQIGDEKYRFTPNQKKPLKNISKISKKEIEKIKENINSDNFDDFTKTELQPRKISLVPKENDSPYKKIIVTMNENNDVGKLYVNSQKFGINTSILNGGFSQFNKTELQSRKISLVPKKNDSPYKEIIVTMDANNKVEELRFKTNKLLGRGKSVKAKRDLIVNAQGKRTGVTRKIYEVKNEGEASKLVEKIKKEQEMNKKMKDAIKTNEQNSIFLDNYDQNITTKKRKNGTIKVMVTQEYGGNDFHHVLGKFFKGNKKYEEYGIWEIYKGMIDKVEKLNSKGIYHLDIKPENFLISKDKKLDSKHQVHIIDFEGKGKVDKRGNLVEFKGYSFTPLYATKKVRTLGLNNFEGNEKKHYDEFSLIMIYFEDILRVNSEGRKKAREVVEKLKPEERSKFLDYLKTKKISDKDLKSHEFRGKEFEQAITQIDNIIKERPKEKSRWDKFCSFFRCLFCLPCRSQSVTLGGETRQN